MLRIIAQIAVKKHNHKYNININTFSYTLEISSDHKIFLLSNLDAKKILKYNAK